MNFKALDKDVYYTGYSQNESNNGYVVPEAS